jgi:voltage-gated potassium channel
MSQILSRALGSVSDPLAVFGLAIVAVLSLPDLASGWHRILEAVLLLIWVAYAVQFGVGLLNFHRHGPAGLGPTLFVDLLSVGVPMLASLLPMDSVDRSIFCAVWVAKPLRDLAAFRLVIRVLAIEARTLFGVMSIFGIILFLAALTAYIFEREAQPVAFGSIPRAMWWAVTTLTTTGYGDAIPQSTAGRILAGVVMMCGIGVFALWAGILATGFAEELRRQDFTLVWQLVSGVPLFAQLPHRDLAEIVRALKPRKAQTGAVICRKGHVGSEMFFILDGKVHVASAPPVILGPGEYFGEMALVSGEPRFATVIAATPVSLLVLHISDFQMLINRDTKLADSIRQTAEERRRVQPDN